MMVPVRVSTMVPHLALFVCKDVRQGEELCFDYADRDRKNVGKSPVLADDESKGVVTSQPKRTPCLCRSYNCSGFLPFDPFLL